VVGDVMVDVCLRVARAVDQDDLASIHGDLRTGRYVAATLHRAENTDDPERLRLLLAALKQLPIPVVLPVHPRLRDRAAAAGVALSGGSLLAIDPLSHPHMVLLTSHARAVVTDSGGLQKEAYVLGVPCTTLRTETEWVETLGDGWNVLAPDGQNLDALAVRDRPTGAREPYFGTGRAADEVVGALKER
jgi:UDP-N-acetylglucosamine 2-epimerase (non-hydrolysing)